MTFEQVLLLYIYQNKKISLNLFGTIELESVVPDPEILRKEKHLPVEGLKFTFNPHVITDDKFIEFYASEKGRIMPLAKSDIELQLHMAKQIVNIGNPFDIPGVGKIIKQDNGILAMVPGYFKVPPAPGSGRPTPLRERAKPGGVLPQSGETESKSVAGGGKTLKIIGLTILILGGATAVIWAIFQYLLPMLQPDPKQASTEIVVADTTRIQEPLPAMQDSLPDSPIAILAAPPSFDDTTVSYTWKAYIRQGEEKNNAERRLSLYKGYGHNVFMDTQDSVLYNIYIKLESNLPDTARKRDSLSKFFAKPVKLEPYRDQQAQ